MRRLIVLVGFVLSAAVATDAIAGCDVCVKEFCTNRNGQEVLAGKCTTDSTEPDGVNNCRTVAGCGGCIGFSCHRRVPVDLAAEPALIPEKTVIRIVHREPAAQP